MGAGKNRGRFWTKILILLFVIATGYLVMTYHQQSQKSDELQQQISDLTSSNTLAMNATKRKSEQSEEQLRLKQDNLERDIEVTEDSLKTSLITNDHIATLVQVAREAGVKLGSIAASEPKPTTLETVTFDIMTLRIEAEGDRSNSIDFVSKICEVFQTGIVRSVGIQFREEPENVRVLLSLDVDIYSYRDQ